MYMYIFIYTHIRTHVSKLSEAFKLIFVVLYAEFPGGTEGFSGSLIHYVTRNGNLLVLFTVFLFFFFLPYGFFSLLISAYSEL